MFSKVDDFLYVKLQGQNDLTNQTGAFQLQPVKPIMAWVGRCQVFGFCLYRAFSQGHEANFNVCYMDVYRRIFQVGYFCGVWSYKTIWAE